MILKRFRGAISASPVVAGKHTCMLTPVAHQYLMDPEKGGAIVGSGDVDAMLIATPVLVDGRILLRTPEQGVCIGKRADQPKGASPHGFTTKGGWGRTE